MEKKENSRSGVVKVAYDDLSSRIDSSRSSARTPSAYHPVTVIYCHAGRKSAEKSHFQVYYLFTGPRYSFYQSSKPRGKGPDDFLWITKARRGGWVTAADFRIFHSSNSKTFFIKYYCMLTFTPEEILPENVKFKRGGERDIFRSHQCLTTLRRNPRMKDCPLSRFRILSKSPLLLLLLSLPRPLFPRQKD